jgi:uracil-DNA glycosylase
MLKVVIFQPNIMKEHLQHRIQKSLMITQLRNLFRPRMEWKEDIEIDWERISLYDYLYQYDGAPYSYFDFFQREDIKALLKTISNQLQQEKRIIYPNIDQVFRALRETEGKPKVIILGQDPYHNGAACGLAFSVERTDEPINPSLVNIFKEVVNCGFEVDETKGNLDLWCRQSVMLLNTSLTVAKGMPESHVHLWKDFIHLFLEYLKPEIGLLWGRHAMKYKEYFKETVCTSHPSPLGAHKSGEGYPAFLGSRCFHKVNTLLQRYNSRIYWSTVDKSYEKIDPAILKNK